MEQYIKLSDAEQEIISKAIDLIRPYDKENVSRYTVYYEVKGDAVGREYDTCGDKECIDVSKKNIRKNYGKYTRVQEVWYNNDSDHENIESCSICFNPLVESLTWIRDEFEHHSKNTLTVEQMKESRNAFDIRVMLESFPSNDHEISLWAMNDSERYKQYKGYQDDFKNAVVAYASKVIENLRD